MNEIALCRTKAGKGMKIVVDDVWFYTSLGEFFKWLNHKANACTFRSIEDKGLPPDVDFKGQAGAVVQQDDPVHAPIGQEE